MAFKVIQGHRGWYQCNFLLVINRLLSRTVSELSQFIIQILDTLFFEPPPPPLGGLGTTYDVHLGLIGKRVVDFILVLIELFFARCYG